MNYLFPVIQTPHLFSTWTAQSTVNKSSSSKSCSKPKGSILKSLSTKDPVVGVLVPGASSGAGVENLVGKVLTGHPKSSPCCPRIYSIVTSEESGSLWS